MVVKLFWVFYEGVVSGMSHDLYARGWAGLELVPRVDPIVYSGGRGPLSEAELEAFEADGYLVLRPCISPADASFALEETNRVVSQGDVPVLHERDSVVLRSVFRLHEDAGPNLSAICNHPTLVGAVRQILGSEVYVHQSRIDFRSLECREHYWESDYETWHAEDGMPSMRAVSACVMLTTDSDANGPLLVVPGSHKTFVPCADVWQTQAPHAARHGRSAVIPRPALTWLIDGGGITALTGAPGTVVLMDCNVLHATPGSLSPHQSANLFVAFNSVENKLVAPFDVRRQPRPDHFVQRDQPRDP